MGEILQTVGLVVGRSKSFTVQIGDLSVGPGEVWAVLGPNGSGKSTLLDTLSGLIKPIQGIVSLKGEDPAVMPVSDRARFVSSVGQREEIPEGFTLREMVVMSGLPRAASYWETSEEWAGADAALHRMDLSGLNHRRSEETSGGEFQRALIARALASDASLIILDEPTSSIDAKHMQRLGDILREEADSGKSIIVSTHSLEWALAFADHFIVVDSGRAAVLDDVARLEEWIIQNLSPSAILKETESGGWSLSLGYSRTQKRSDRNRSDLQ